MLSAEDRAGSTTFYTNRALVLAVGNEVEGISPGDIIIYNRNDVDLRKEQVNPYDKQRIINPSHQFATYKKAYLDEEDPQDCAEIWDSQAKAIANTEDFIFSAKVQEFFSK